MSNSERLKGTEIKEPDPGVFITKGMRISIPEFSIQMAPEGWFNVGAILIHTGIDLCPYWLEIAYEHLLRTEKADTDLQRAKEAKNDEKIAAALQAEFTAGMQAIMASGIAIDAYYACVKELINIPRELTQAWRTSGTARYRQIAEVLKRAFPMSQESAKQLREILKQNIGFRDKAVHPPSGTEAPLLHPELNRLTDWRYVTFRYYNAKNIVGLTLSVIAQTASRPHKNKFETLSPYCKALMLRVTPLLDRWAEHYGKLFD
jgi:hypothetical protein